MNLVGQLLLNLALCYALKVVLKVTVGLLFNAYLELIEGRSGTRLSSWAKRSVALLTSFIPTS